MVSEYTIHTLLAQAAPRGWYPTSRGSMTSGWHLAYESRLAKHTVFLDVRDAWVYLQAPVLRLEPAANCREALLDHLLRLNNRMFLAKFALISARPEKKTLNWVVLTADWPAEVFDSGAFGLMTEAMATYLDRYFREIQAIAHEEAIASLVREAAATTARPPRSTSPLSVKTT